MKMDKEKRRVIRILTGSAVNIPIVEVDGDDPPREAGESFYWTTPSGKTRVSYPRAYGWRTVYHHSTLRVEVGRDWRPPELVRVEDSGFAVQYMPETARGVGDWTVGRYVAPVRPFAGIVRNGLLLRHSSGWAYHVRSGEDVGGWGCCPTDFDEPWKLALLVQHGQRKREQQQAADRAAKATSFSGMDLRAVPVTIDTSLRAGNCRDGTMAFSYRHRLGNACPASRLVRFASNPYVARVLALAAKECVETIMI
jgi:hypothetical protein